MVKGGKMDKKVINFQQKSDRKPNRAERRRWEKEHRAEMKQNRQKRLIENRIAGNNMMLQAGQVDIPILCPECESPDITEMKPDFFRCNNCGAEHSLQEMTCYLPED